MDHTLYNDTEMILSQKNWGRRNTHFGSSLNNKVNDCVLYIYRRFFSRSRVYGSLVIPKLIDRSKVTVMSHIYIPVRPVYKG